MIRYEWPLPRDVEAVRQMWGEFRALAAQLGYPRKIVGDYSYGRATGPGRLVLRKRAGRYYAREVAG